MPSARAAVVFVHGMFSSARTWSQLIERMGEDAELGERYRVFPFEYASPKVRVSPLRRIPDYDVIADDLTTFLDVDVAEYGSVVLVGHSQGGLIIQRYLARVVKAGRARKLARIKAIIMFACPNSGSQLALLLRRSARFWENPQEKQLRPINDEVIDAQRYVLERIQFARDVDDQNCPIPIYVYAGTEDNVVTPASARGVFPEAKALPGDHSTILHADSASSRTFTALRSHLREVLAAPDAARSGPEPARDGESDGDPALRASDRSLLAVRHNVIPLPSAFFNRERESSRALEGLSSSCSVVSVSGLGGMGKTALANRIAWRLTKDRNALGPPGFGAIVWCDLAAGGLTLDSFIDTIADVIGYPYIRALSMPEKANRVVHHLNTEPCLVVIDNFDGGRDHSIRELVSRVDPSVSKILVTSRQVYSAEAWPVDVGGLDENASRRLIAEEGRRLGISTIPVSDSELIPHYLDATGGNPLAIRLTTGQMRYGDDLAAATARLRSATEADLFDRIFDRTWHELLASNERARAIVIAVALHPAPVPLDALARAVDADADEIRREIRDIGEASLLEMARSGRPPVVRVRLHPLTRAYALRQVAKSPGYREEIEARLVTHYLELAQANSEVYTVHHRVGVLESEYRNIIHFAQLAAERADGSENPRHDREVIAFAEAMAGFLWGRGYWRDRVQLCRNAAAAAIRVGDPIVLARQYAMVGRVHVWLGDYAEASTWLEHSRAALPRNASAADRRETVRLGGHIASGTGDYATAQTLFEQVLAAAPHTADDEGRAATLVELAICAYRRGEYPIAITRLDEACRLDERMGAIEGLAVTSSHLANAHYESGDNQNAKRLFEQGLTFARQVGRPMTEGRCLIGLAKINVLERRRAEARTCAEAAAETFTRLGMKDLAAEARLILGNLGDHNPAAGRAPRVPDLLGACRAVLFDFDDTIAATTSRWPLLRRTAARFGADLDDDTIRAAWGLPFDELIRAIVPGTDREAFVRAYRQAMLEVKPISTIGAIQLITGLHRRGVRQLIISSGAHDLVMQDLRELGVAGYFDEVYAQENSPARKPDPRVLHGPIDMLRRQGIDRDDIVYIGDSVRDLRAAHGNGVAFVAVLTGAESREDFRAAGLPDELVAPDLSHVRLWL
ncbi:alpha/beta fold hydrolase [Nocardia sp. NEAU-G5]|uniref:Alpha/beta fold hydrolase n=1 Tax=Nocardia albiluteola TaxID=2842303 RepID=A0ABS6B6C7_9NOCA|nr:alpha/beta fold hydrolase [Nocardia albiluteola]MBU3064753.1 alpha/beta fold hydrolase [Nocardia albiluteola]